MTQSPPPPQRLQRPSLLVLRLPARQRQPLPPLTGRGQSTSGNGGAIPSSTWCGAYDDALKKPCGRHRLAGTYCMLQQMPLPHAAAHVGFHAPLQVLDARQRMHGPVNHPCVCTNVLSHPPPHECSLPAAASPSSLCTALACLPSTTAGISRSSPKNTRWDAIHACMRSHMHSDGPSRIADARLHSDKRPRQHHATLTTAKDRHSWEDRFAHMQINRPSFTRPISLL